MYENESNSYSNKKKKSEYKNKELLYNLYYEIKSEILGTKIEIDEDEYQEKVEKITIPKLISYIHDSIQILITSKIENSKNEQKIEDENYIRNSSQTPLPISEIQKYENIIKKLEEKERFLSKIRFQNQLQKEAMENKISDYMEMEDEFEEMKAKLKYEDGRFLNNDRKDNEIIIIRSENSKLKNIIDDLEKENDKLQNLIKEKNKEITTLKEEVDKLNKRNTDMYKYLLENEDLNINTNMNLTERYTKNKSNTNYLKILSDNKEANNNSSTIKYLKYQKINLQPAYYKKIKKKIYNNKKKSEGNKTSNNEKKSTKENTTNANINNNNDLLSTTRNEYTEKLKPKLNKYFSGNNINKTGNKSCNKKNKNINKYLPMNNSHIGMGKLGYLFNNNVVNNKNIINNLYSVKKIIANNNIINKEIRPNSSTKVTSKYRGLIYRSASGDN